MTKSDGQLWFGDDCRQHCHFVIHSLSTVMVLFVWNEVSEVSTIRAALDFLHNPGWHWPHKILLPQAPKCWHFRCVPPHRTRQLLSYKPYNKKSNLPQLILGFPKCIFLTDISLHRYSYKNLLKFYWSFCGGGAVLPTCMFLYHKNAWHSIEVRRGHWVLWNCSYGWLWASIWVLRLKPGPSAITRALNCWATSCHLLLQKSSFRDKN